MAAVVDVLFEKYIFAGSVLLLDISLFGGKSLKVNKITRVEDEYFIHSRLTDIQ